MISRRTLLGSLSAAAVVGAGCTGRIIGESVQDIRDFGAAVDGTTDDTQAVREAIDAAASGETVFFPEGTTLVSVGENENNAAIQLDGDDVPGDLTLRGAGSDSVVKMDGGHEGQHRVFWFEVNSGYDNLVVRDLAVDGNKDEQHSQPGNGGHAFHSYNADSEEVPVDVLIENVWVENCNQSGITPRHGGFVVNRCTVRNCTKHGISPDSWTDVYGHDPPIEVTNCYLTENGQDGETSAYGVNVSGGKVIVEDCVCENNAQGTKTTPQVIEATYRRVRFKDNDYNGYLRPSTEAVTDDRAQVVFEDVISEGNQSFGFRLGRDTDYTVPEDAEIVAYGNARTGGSNIYLTQNARLDAKRIWSISAVEGYGFDSNTSATSSIEEYYYFNNEMGSTNNMVETTIGSNRNLEDQTDLALSEDDSTEDSVIEYITETTTIGAVPTASEVGADDSYTIS